MGIRGAPPAPSPRAGGAGMFSLPGTFLHTAKINRGLLMELLFLTSVAQKCQSYRTAPRHGARSQQPRGRGAPASGSPGQELGGASSLTQEKGTLQLRGSGPLLGMLTQPSLRRKASRLPSEPPAPSSAHRLWHAPESLNIFTTAKFLQGKHFAKEEEGGGKGRRKPTNSCFSALQPALTFIFSPSLRHFIAISPGAQPSFPSYLESAGTFFFPPEHFQTFQIVWWEFGFQAAYLFALWCQRDQPKDPTRSAHSEVWAGTQSAFFSPAHFSVIAGNHVYSCVSPI